jgi:hypothetical protein
MSDYRTKILQAIDTLAEALDAAPSEVTAEIGSPAVEELSKEEISLNVAGHKDFWIENGELFNQMKKYYNPEKAPFDGSTWLLTSTQYLNGQTYKNGYLRDARPYKTVIKEGKPYRKMAKQVFGPDWYWIGKGISDVTAPEWNGAELTNDLPREQRLELIRNYKGGLNTGVDNWPVPEFNAYKETH